MTLSLELPESTITDLEWHCSWNWSDFCPVMEENTNAPSTRLLCLWPLTSKNGYVHDICYNNFVCDLIHKPSHLLFTQGYMGSQHFVNDHLINRELKPGIKFTGAIILETILNYDTQPN